MPSLFSSMKTRKSKRHSNRPAHKRGPPAATPLPSHTFGKTGAGSSTRHSQANEGGQGLLDSTALVSPSPSPTDSSSDLKSTNESGTNALTILPPTPKTLSQQELSGVVSQDLPTRLARKVSRVSFSDMKFGGTSGLGGHAHGRKSQYQGRGDDKEPLSDMRARISTVGEREDVKDGRNGATYPPPLHGIMKTTTNVSVGAGTHSVRFTLDLPPTLDLDLSLSDEKGEGGNSDSKDGVGLTRKPSKWGRKTTEAVLDRSNVVSTEFIPCEDHGGHKSDESDKVLEERREGDEVSLDDATDTAVSLHEQQNVQRGHSHTSSISTLECEPSFTIYGLEDLAAGFELPPNGRKTLPVVPTPGYISSGPEGRFSRHGVLGSDRKIEEIIQSSASGMDSSRKGSYRGYQSNSGCVSA